MTEASSAPTRQRRLAKWRAVVAGLAVTVVIVAVPLLLGGGEESPSGLGGEDHALVTVRAAVGWTVASGSFETDFETHSTYPISSPPQRCSPGGSCQGSDGTSTFESRGHGVVNFDPYVSRVVTDSSVGPRILVVTSTTVWLTSGDGGSTIVPGIPLSEFASSVQSTLGPSQGALAMVSLASPGGSLNLEEEAIVDATPAGTGSVDGTSVTYYDVTIDMTKLADAPDLTDVQRATIEAALPLLRQGGYTGTTERIGVDAAGMIREVTATTHFADGSTGTRQTILSNFGCAPKISPPDQPAPAVTAPSPCAAPDTTTTSPPTSTPTSTSTTSAPTIANPPLDDTQTVSFDVSGFIAGETVFLNQCRTDPRSCAGFSVEELHADEGGSVAGDYSPQQWIFSQSGWVDCMHEPCVLQLQGTSSQVIRTIPVDVSDRAPLARPSPTMTLQPPGPYTEGQVITVNITGVPPGVDGTLSICTKVPPDAAHSGLCVVPVAGFFATGADGSVTLTGYQLPPHPCRSQGSCELAWDPGYDFPPLVAQEIHY